MPNAFDFGISGDPNDNYERASLPLMRPFVEAAIEAARLAPSESVLDVACGTGFVARAAAEAVGPLGRIAAVDVNGPRLDYARTAAKGVTPPIEWYEASAEQMPFGNDEFDAVVCQQGFQHFPNLEAAVSEMARVSRHGARIVGTVWAQLDHQGYWGPLIEVCSAYFSAEATERMRSLFSRLPVEAVLKAYESAGLQNVTAEEITGLTVLPLPEVFAPLQLAILGPFTEEARQLPQERITNLVEELSSAFAGFRSGPGLQVPLASWLVAATR